MLAKLEQTKRAFDHYDTTVFDPTYRYIEATDAFGAAWCADWINAMMFDAHRFLA
jgi:hypothetical protein